MDKEFKLYKAGRGKFELLSAEDVSGRHRKLQFTDMSEPWSKDDALIAIKDRDHNNWTAVMVVESINDDGTIVVRTPGWDFMRDIRKFEKGEIFTITATYRATNGNNNNTNL